MERKNKKRFAYKTRTVSLRLSPREYEAIERNAVLQEISASELIRQAVQKFLSEK